MVDEVGTVATRAAQLWLTASEAEMGWDGPSEVTLSGFGATFDTWASMPHLLPLESSPHAGGPRSLAYLCSALPDPATDAGEAGVAEALRGFLDGDVGALWPGIQGADGFRWALLVDPEGRSGPHRLAAQYVRANVDPSDRYVQSLPGSGRHRIAPGPPASPTSRWRRATGSAVTATRSGTPDWELSSGGSPTAGAASGRPPPAVGAAGPRPPAHPAACR